MGDRGVEGEGLILTDWRAFCPANRNRFWIECGAGFHREVTGRMIIAAPAVRHLRR
jgi:hypothetical protein